MGNYMGAFRGGKLFFVKNLLHVVKNEPSDLLSLHQACSHIIQFRRYFSGEVLIEAPELSSISMAVMIRPPWLEIH